MEKTAKTLNCSFTKRDEISPKHMNTEKSSRKQHHQAFGSFLILSFFLISVAEINWRSCYGNVYELAVAVV